MYISDLLSFFKNNKHIAVKISDCLSQETDQTSDITHGSSIGPSCFFIYIDLPFNIKYCTIKLFADEVKLYFDFVRDDILSTHKLKFGLNSLA